MLVKSRSELNFIWNATIYCKILSYDFNINFYCNFSKIAVNKNLKYLQSICIWWFWDKLRTCPNQTIYTISGNNLFQHWLLVPGNGCIILLWQLIMPEVRTNMELDQILILTLGGCCGCDTYVLVRCSRGNKYFCSKNTSNLSRENWCDCSEQIAL